MLQPYRNANSKSFLREILYALLTIKDEKTRNYFLEKMRVVFEKRNNPNSFFTGERELKKELLAYLQTQGEIATANIWARGLDYSKNAIAALNKVLGERLIGANAQGVCEIHLQDREINSPHIQYIGTNAGLAEQIIGRTLVEFGFESDLSSAIGKKSEFVPYYLENEKARTQDLQIMIDYKERQKENEFDKFDNKFENELNLARKLLEKIKQSKIRIKEKSSLAGFRQGVEIRKMRLRKIMGKLKGI